MLRASELDFDFVVDASGGGDFETLQEAFDAVPDFRKQRTRILLKKGVYEEKLVLGATKVLVTLVGEDAENTVIQYGQHAKSLNRFGEEVGTTGSSSFYVFGDDFYAKNLSFANTAGPVGQAVAVRVNGDRVFFENCRFLGNQDTLYPHGEGVRQYYKDCYIEGTVDFIFGKSTAVFEDCEIRCKAKGYVTAAATPEGAEYGFVFKQCRIVGDAAEGSFYLGRPWRDHAQVVFVDCYLGAHIKPEGWHNWGQVHREQTAYFAELNSTGPGANPEGRVSWSRQLSEEDRPRYELSRIFGDWTPGE